MKLSGLLFVNTALLCSGLLCSFYFDGPLLFHRATFATYALQEIGLIAVGVASLLLVIGGLTGALLLNWKDCRAFK